MILLLQYRTDISGPHEVSCFYNACEIPYNQYFILNLNSPKVTKTMVEDFISKSKGVILGGLAEGGFEDLQNPKISKKQKDKFLQTVDFINPIVFQLAKQDIPTIAVCFGHQLILKRLGATLSFDLKHQETGIYKIYTTEQAETDPVFKDLQPHFWAVIAHKTSVVKLPQNPELPIVHLASSDKTPIQAVRINNNFYSLQFHPELNRKEFIYRLQFYPSYLKSNPDAINSLPDVEVRATHILTNWLNKIVKI